MFKVFNYRLYPTTAQRKRLESTLETARRFYNDCLGERKAVYEVEKRTVKKVEQLRRVKVHKANNPFATNVHSHILQVVVADLDKAFTAFFRRMKAGETPGYPRFKGRNRFHSFGFKEIDNGFKIDGRRLKLSGIGRVAVRWHRPLEGKIKTVRICQKAGKWYASFCCEAEVAPLPPLATEVGIDAGLSNLLVLSTGQKVPNPRFYRKSQARLRVLQRSVARKKRGGSNRHKAVRRLAVHAEHVANQRKDYLNKLVCTLVGCFQCIAVEDLSINRMVHGNLAKSILDAGWGFFKQRLLSKAENAGRTVVLVDPAYTTQDCCQCGQRQKISLKDRWYRCICGNSKDRDENAALNVLAQGRRVWGASSSVEGLAQEAMPLKAAVECHCQDVRRKGTTMRLTKEMILAGNVKFTVSVPSPKGTAKYTYSVKNFSPSGKVMRLFFLADSYIGKLNEFTGQVDSTAGSSYQPSDYFWKLLNKILVRVWCDDHEAYERHGYSVEVVEKREAVCK